MTSDATPPKLTDNPWFWLMLFSAMGLTAATTIAPKYAVRMARKERMMHANEVIAVARESGVRAADVEQTAPSVIPYTEADYRRQPKFQIMYGLLLLLVVVGCVGTVRSLKAAHSAVAGTSQSST